MPPCPTLRLAPWLLAGALAASPATAAEPAPADEGEASALLQALSAKLEAQAAEIAQLREEVEELQLAQMRGRGMADGPVAQQAPPPVEPERIARQQATAPRADEPVQVGQARREEDEQRRQQEKALVVREHAPLFERRFTFDTGLAYSYYDRRALTLSGFLALDAIFLGTINLDQSKATVGTFDITGRYGLTDRLSLEASIPYVVRDTRFVSGGAGGAATSLSEVQVRSQGLGDVSVAAYYQLVKESARFPDVVASLRLRAPTGRDPFGLKLISEDPTNTNIIIPEDLPTGTGVWSATANVSVLRTYDPVILFANLGYTHHRSGEFDDVSPVMGTVTPAKVSLGHILQFSGGMALALNDRAAMSFSIATAMQAATHTLSPGQDDSLRVPGSSSNATTLNLGMSYVLPSGWTFNGQAAAGLTPDAPNFVLGVRASRSF